MKKNSPQPDRIMRPRDVEAFVNVTTPTLLRMVKRGEFPKPFKLSDSGNAVGWRLSVVMAWLESRDSRSNAVR